MKCSVCAKEIAQGSTWCEFCGQPVRQEQTFPVVREHWDAVEKDIASYEQERKQKAAGIRKYSRRIRIRWVLMALAAAFAVWFFTGNSEGKALRTKGEQYMNAWWTYQQGDYHLAQEQFSLLDENFLNTGKYLYNCQQHILGQEYDYAVSVFNAGRYEEAMQLFYALGEYADAPWQVNACLECIRANLPECAMEWDFSRNPEEVESIPWSGNADWKRVVDSKIRYAAFFDGKDSLNLEGCPAVSGDWTITATLGFRLEEDMTIFSVYNPELERVFYQLDLKDKRLQWTVVDAQNNIDIIQGGTEIEPGRKWYYVGITCRDNVLRLYLDGVLEAECTVSGPMEFQGTEQIQLGGMPGGWVWTGEEMPKTYQGYISNVSYYDQSVTDLEMSMMYEPREYLATHLWDTSFYFLPEGVEDYDNFVFFQTSQYEHHMCLAVLRTTDPQDEPKLYWNREYERIEFVKTTSVAGYDMYYLDGESWIYIDNYEGFSCIYDVVAVTSSDLYLYGDGDYELLPVIIGGRD